METPNEIKNIHDAVKVLSKETSRLVSDHNSDKKINIAAEAAISKRFDTLARNAATLIDYRKQTGSKDPIWFFEED